MTDTESLAPRDDRAWPRAALPFSLVVGLCCLAGGLVVALQDERVVFAVLLLCVGLVAGSSLLVFGFIEWFRGKKVPFLLGPVGAAVAVGGFFFLAQGDYGLGTPFLLGMLGGCMFANVWAISRARRNRPA